MAAPVRDDALPPLAGDVGDAAAAEFEAFDRFPWSKHRAFLLGLVETLGGAGCLSPDPTHQGSATFCRTVFYRRQTGRRIDLTQYNSFLAGSPAYPSVDRRLLAALYAAKRTAAETADGTADEEPTAATDAASHLPRRIVEAVAAGPAINPFDSTATPPLDDVPSWQRSAPRNELRVPRTALASDDAAAAAAAAAASASGEAPYSDKFARVIEAVQTGKELEGIRQIPDTVVRQAGITPLGKLKAPRKPWEVAAAPPSLVDLQFPPPPEPAADQTANDP